ncbi:hypothetical protein [Salinibaculum rarum]|uniref:hypothetical protein n=1 Tax=Salinibaculum rarum TaxID=3058903 RepID=UPI00265E218C|nr:hypothetical protein [Salinibaculum sp. KK48]
MVETTRDYTGDVTLTGQETPPVEVIGPEDVFIERGAVDGDLKLRDVEYVYTHTPITGDAEISAVTTRITGALEDAYAEPDGADGDVVIEHAEDVFIEAGGVSGDVTAHGAENIFDDTGAGIPSLEPSEYDVTVTGWKQQTHYEHPVTGVYLTGAKHSVTVNDIDDDIAVYVTGWDHDVTLRGDGTGIRGDTPTVSVYLLGRDNTLDVGSHLSVDVVSDPGMRNTVEEQPVSVDAVIETSRSEAFPMFGRRKVTYQTPAAETETCPGCGEDADGIIARQHMDAFFLFGHPVKVYDQSSNPPKECEHCATPSHSPTSF